jgi:hypothetical protein
MAHPDRRPLPYAALGLSAAVTLILVAAAWTGLESVHAGHLAARLLWPLSRLIGWISIGLVVGQVIEATGWTRRLALLADPVFQFNRLGIRCAAAFTSAFFSGVAANAMLLSFLKENTITRRQLFLSNLMNQFPAFFLHLPTTFFIVIPLTGWAGALYFLLTFIALVIRTLAVMVAGRLFSDAASVEPAVGDAAPAPADRHGKTKRLAAGIRQRLPGRLMRILIYVVPIYTLVFVVSAAGGFDAARQWMARFVVTRILPVESLSVVILSFAAEFTSGFAAAGALMKAGVLTVKQTVIALLAGNIIAFPIRALRHQLPRYVGIFAPKMGLQLLLLGQGLRVASLIVVGVGYYLLF